MVIDCVYLYVILALRNTFDYADRLLCEHSISLGGLCVRFATLLFISRFHMPAHYDGIRGNETHRSFSARPQIDLLSPFVRAFVGETELAGFDCDTRVTMLKYYNMSGKREPPTDELDQPKFCLLSIEKEMRKNIAKALYVRILSIHNVSVE